MKTIIKFTAAWCAPCKAMEPDYNLFKSNNPQVSFIDVDVDASPGQVRQYGIKNVPTFIYLDDGKEYKRLMGRQTISQLNNNL